MNVGIVTTWFERGAAYVSKAYRDVLQGDHNVFIFARGGERQDRGSEKWNKPFVTWYDIVEDPPTKIEWRPFYNWVTANDLDLILFNEQQHWGIVAECARNLTIPIGAYIDYYTHQTKSLFGLYDFVICNTKRHYSVFRNHPQAFYIPWGTDVTEFAPSEHRSGEFITFVHSAGFNPYRKGTHFLLEAFSRLNHQAKLIIYAQKDLTYPCDPKLYQENPNIKIIIGDFPGTSVYHSGDIYLYPSVLDGIGLTVPEALASGLPVITTNAPPMNEFVDDSVGRLVEVEGIGMRKGMYYWPESYCSIDSLTQAMAFFCNHRDNLMKYQKSARSKAEELLDWSVNARDLSQLLSTIKTIPQRQKLTLCCKAEKYQQECASGWSLQTRVYRKFIRLWQRLAAIKYRLLWLIGNPRQLRMRMGLGR